MKINSLVIKIKNHHIKINVSHNKLSKNLRLSLNPAKKKFLLTLPYGTPANAAKSFIEKSSQWIEKRIELITNKSIPFKDGVFIPILGNNYQIKYISHKTPRAFTKESNLIIQGSNLEKIIKKWLKSQIALYLTKQSQLYASQINCSINKIKIKELKSSWGSCSSKANLSFSWRLVFAPIEVIKYICAHEVAHLIHLNHSKIFWHTVQNLYPNFKVQRLWLKNNGSKLFLYG